jgi:hypothetical protein
MTSQVDEIEDMARGLVERFGPDALRQAALRIEELSANNQLEAVVLWRKIEKTIKRMT